MRSRIKKVQNFSNLFQEHIQISACSKFIKKFIFAQNRFDYKLEKIWLQVSSTIS